MDDSRVQLAQDVRLCAGWTAVVVAKARPLKRPVPEVAHGCVPPGEIGLVPGRGGK